MNVEQRYRREENKKNAPAYTFSILVYSEIFDGDHCFTIGWNGVAIGKQFFFYFFHFNRFVAHLIFQYASNCFCGCLLLHLF